MPPVPLDAAIGRRLLLLAASAALTTGATACASSTQNRQDASADTPGTPRDQFAALERAYSARLGVYALDTNLVARAAKIALTHVTGGSVK